MRMILPERCAFFKCGYTSFVSRYLHQLSAFFFYVLGLSFFAAYILLRNDVVGEWSALWLQVADLPFILSAVLYGGLSLYFSLVNPGQRSRSLGFAIAIPLALIFLLLVVFNFWGVWPFVG